MRETFDLRVRKRQSYFVIIEEYRSTDFYTYLDTNKFKNEEEKRNIIKGIVEGLNYLHSHHLAHLDIKPENITLDDNHTPKICDFNISEFVYKNHFRISPKRIKYYVSPELFNLKEINKINYFKCDIWSLGITLYYLSERDLPYLTIIIMENYI